MSTELDAGPARDLIDFAALTSAEVTAVRAAIELSAIDDLDEDALAGCFEAALPTAEGAADRGARLAKALWSICRLLVDSSNDAETTLDYIGDWSIKDAGLPKATWATARMNLLQLSDLDVLYAAVKSEQVRGECERQLQTAKILTDIRPVFGRDVGPPSCFVLIHTLHLTHTSAEHDAELFVSVDEDDLRHLRSQIDRAFEKADELRSLKLSNEVKILK
jgi:hypothetical protein